MYHSLSIPPYRHIIKVHSIHSCKKRDRSENRSNDRENKQNPFLLLGLDALHDIVHIAASIGAVLDIV